jgi:hypothetical protein
MRLPLQKTPTNTDRTTRNNNVKRASIAACSYLPRLQPMSPGKLPSFPSAECGEVWLPADEDRWRAYLDAGGELYCPECAEREFD